MRLVVFAHLLWLAFTAVCFAQKATPYQMPAEELQSWRERLSRFVGAHMWTVAVNGNQVVLRRKQPVAMVASLPNQQEGESEWTPMGSADACYVIQFAPKLSLAEYDRLAEVNAASAAEEFRLRRVANVPHKFDQFVATTPEERQRLQTYRDAVAKLPRHELPVFYSPEQSIFIYRSWHEWDRPAENDVDDEIQRIEASLARVFGMYDAGAAGDGQSHIKFRKMTRHAEGTSH
jgi:hypothetical protein